MLFSSEDHTFETPLSCAILFEHFFFCCFHEGLAILRLGLISPSDVNIASAPPVPLFWFSSFARIRATEGRALYGPLLFYP